MFTLSKRPYRLTAFLLLLIVAGGLLWFYLRTPPLLAAQLDKPFTLQMNQRADLADADLRVTWAGVADGRCSQCTATFNAIVTLQLQVAGQPVAEQFLSTPPFITEYRDTLTVAGYQIQLLDLDPTPYYPRSVVPSWNYRLQLQVTRLAPK